MTDKTSKEAASLVDEGKSLFRDKHYQQAGEVFSRAADRYQQAELPALAAEALNNQAVALLMAGKPRRAEEVLQGTAETFRKAGDTLKQGMALANQGAVRKDLGDRQGAVDFFTQAAAIFQEAGEGEMHLETMQSVSSLKLRSGDLTGALFAMQTGLASVEKPSWRQKLLRSFLQIPNKLLNR
jgi:tetratricopeptide (TPR) repeat protein